MSDISSYHLLYSLQISMQLYPCTHKTGMNFAPLSMRLSFSGK